MAAIDDLRAAWRFGIDQDADALPSDDQLNEALKLAGNMIARYVPADKPLSADAHNGLLIPIALYLSVAQKLDEHHPVYVSYKDAISWLQQLAAGKLDEHVGDGGATTDSDSAGEPMFDAPARIFDTKALKDF